MKKIFILCVLISSLGSLFGQEVEKKPKLHSHNDYLQVIPFWEAYANEVESIEADVFLMDGELYVAHEKESIIKDRTLASLYLDPIRKAFELNLGGKRAFQLLIDIKTEPYSTLKKLEEVLSTYQDLWDGGESSSQLNIVISGNRPKPEEYDQYPAFILFDYQSVAETTSLPLHKIALISLNFRKLSSWEGKGPMEEKELAAIKNAVDVAHSLNRPIRFWATPDEETAWRTLLHLDVDFINTDKPYEARSWLDDYLN